MAVRHVLHRPCAYRATSRPALRAHPGGAITATGLLSRPELLLIAAATGALLLTFGLRYLPTTSDIGAPVVAQITVQRGDTLWSLAQEYGDPDEYILARVHALMKANGLKKGIALREGQTLIVPVTNRSSALYYRGKYADSRIAE